MKKQIANGDSNSIVPVAWILQWLPS